MYDKQFINELFFEGQCKREQSQACLSSAECSLTSIFYQLVRVSIGTAGCLSRTPNESEWGELYAMAKKQSLVGVCFAGVQQLYNDNAKDDDNRNRSNTSNLSELQYLTWLGMAAKIQQRNEIVNRQCVDLQKRLSADGMRSCILKGQGVAQLYGSLAGLRQSGDIDIWVEGGYKKVASWLKTVESECDFDDHHAHLHVFGDTDVEVHFTPYTLRHQILNRRLQRWFASQADAQFSNSISMKDGELCVPTAEFNLVYQLCHVYNHFFTEGVGLRQLMDYYFVLRTSYDNTSTGSAQAENENVVRVVQDFGLERFAAALLWVVGYVFEGKNLGTSETIETFQTLGFKPNEKDGRFLLEEVMKSGNFGKTDERNRGLYDNTWNRFWVVHMKTFRLWRFDHWAWFWSPISRVSGFIKSKIR